MKHRILTVAILIVMATLTFGCSGDPTTTPAGEVTVIAAATAASAPPTDTPVPPTDTPIPPTDTPLPPTATATATNTAAPTATNTLQPTSTSTRTRTPTRTLTRKPPTATTAPVTLQTALLRTASHSHRFEMHEYFSDPYQQIEVMKANGETTDQATHMYISGPIIERIKPGGLEAIATKDKYYYHGPFPDSSADEARWYVYAPSTGEASGAGAVNADLLLSPGVTRYDKIGSEKVDGLACDIYSIDKEAARWALAATGAMTSAELNNIVNIEFTYWWCADGYIHQARVRTDFKYPPNPATTMISRIESHFYDFNVPIQVNVPTDAVPLP